MHARGRRVPDRVAYAGVVDAPPKKLLLLDTASLYFRAFHAVPESITAADGTPVNALRGLTDMIARLLRDRRPAKLVACMDADWRPAFRVDALPSYKAHRLTPEGGEQTPHALQAQVPLIERMLDAVGIARVGVAGYEADDVIGTLATDALGPVEVVTGDRDLFQLVDDVKPVRVLYTLKGIAGMEVVDEERVRERYGIPPYAYADYALLRGDPSDGLPGVAGIGAKTAAALVSEFGTLEKILAAVDGEEIPARTRARLQAARGYLAAAPIVVRVVREVPLPSYDENLPAGPADPAEVAALREEWNCDGPLERLLAALPGKGA